MNYKVRQVLTGQSFDLDKYHAYSPLYITVGAYVGYWTGLAIGAALLMHTALHYGPFLWRAATTGKAEADDVHALQMEHYKDVPRFAYPLMAITGLALSIAAVEVFHVGLPIWALLMSIFWAGLFLVPSALLYAQTNYLVSPNISSEVIVGYMLPGKPIPNMVFKAYAVSVSINATYVLQGLKLGHYSKVPPRISFLAQSLALLWVNVIQIGVKQFLITNVPDICTRTQSASLTCPGHTAFFSSSIVWGAIGPARIFSNGALYSTLYWSIFVGALLPVPLFFLARRYADIDWVQHINVPAMLYASFAFPGVSTFNIASFLLVNFVFGEFEKSMGKLNW